MSKPATLIMKPRYLYIKQIKINYDIQFSTDLILNNEIKKKTIDNFRGSCGNVC